ncbi:MAG: hypothetical protein A2170_11135 [Deltaproteobacteria bacterium RBG_13_53_10]|nr:MAG: hypothetical protein A2170_11135 [Deltaproteobacteria bacterium RBG_13_53_10]
MMTAILFLLEWGLVIDQECCQSFIKRVTMRVYGLDTGSFQKRVAWYSGPLRFTTKGIRYKTFSASRFPVAGRP